MQVFRRVSVLIAFAFSAVAGPPAPALNWHAGTWDSTQYLRAEHPKTVAIRMELLDKDTHIPVSGVRVSLEGQYWEQRISQDIVTAQNVPWWNIFVDPEKREPQPKEFRLDAVSDSDGVVVFALQWQKEFPWDSKIGDKWTYQVHDEWIIYLDDIEKVQRLEVRHPQYRYIEAPLDFRHIVGLQPYIDAHKRNEDRIELLEMSWKKEISRNNVRMFVLDLGTEFPDYKNQFCERSEFFQQVREKDYGIVYRNPDNLPNLGDRTKCGPYFVYDLGEILLERIATRIDVGARSGSILTTGAGRTGAPWYSQYARESASGSAEQTSAADVVTENAGALLNQEETLLKAEIEKLKDLSLPSLEELRNDPAKLAELVQKTGALKNQLAIGGLRALPMVDPDTGQMTTLDGYARKIAEDKQLGGSLGEDPVATAYMMLIDSNFLVDEARIVRLKDGQYVSLTEAMGVAAAQSDSGLDPEVLKRAVRTAASVHQASRLSEGQLLTKALTSLPFAVSELNAFGAGPKTPGGPSVSENDALYCPELSMSLKTLTPELCKEFGLHAGAKGAVIVRIDPDAPPGHDDLKPGMVIYSWGHGERIAEASVLAQRAREMVSTPAALRGSGRDQALLYVWKWKGTSWESVYEIIWVVRKKDGNGASAQSKSIDLGRGLSMEFVRIEPGYFYMGSESSESGRDDDEGPVRRVQISRPFCLAKYEVTQDQYMAIMGKNPSHFSGRNLPVESVSWNEAVDFCRRLSRRAGTTCRLPTEAEWEYACRAGTNSRLYFGSSERALKDHAWCRDNSGSRTHSVGQKKPNAWGLYDMSGNVWEWCQDWYASSYRNASTTNPKGPSSGKSRVCRGGCWNDLARGCRSANRYGRAPGRRHFSFGFRVALDSK